ncbi:YARHG domain-containing protein [Tepidibacter thalassicus]|nr:YARHG domain-containing protein [Tepidibacter thalassicus]
MKYKISKLISAVLILIFFIYFNLIKNNNISESNLTLSTINKTNQKINNNKLTSPNTTLVLNGYEFNLTQIFKEDLLSTLDKDELIILRNAIYAKHGYIFTQKKYNDYFLQFNWYKPTSNNVSQLLTSVDHDNIKRIIQLEQVLEKLEFKSNKLGFSITFPHNWKNKYKIVEYDTYMIVYFNPSKNVDFKGGEFFLIIDTKSSYFNQENFDTISDKNFFEIGNRQYYICIPTDFPLPENHPEIELFLKMQSDIPNILKTIKPL